MKISRRTFILSGLISAVGLFYWKRDFLVTDVELFLSNFDSLIPLEDVPDLTTEVVFFEKTIFPILSNKDLTKAYSIVNQMIKDEYESGKIKLMSGWVVSETEFGILILKKKYV